MNDELKNAIISKSVIVTELTNEQLMSIGFQFYDEIQALLIPLWVYHFIPDGTELTSINGEVKIKGKDYIDLDVRGGFISFGIQIQS